MATDATGTPTALGIPKFNTSADAPSGLGGNAQMDSIDALIQANTGFQGSGIVIKGNKLVSTDANTAFSLFGNGTMKWGPGGVTALDTTLARTGSGILSLTGTLNATALQVGGNNVLTSVSVLVTSFNSRTGAVAPTSGDYTAAQVTNAADKSSASAQSFAGAIASTNASGGVGYATGAGSSVTQLTSKATAVTITTPTGSVVTNNSALASGASASFTVAGAGYAGGLPIVAVVNNANYRVEVESIQSLGNPSNFRIRITNISGGSLSDVLTISYAIITGVTS